MVESITFVFENCEYVEFSMKYVGLFYINEITQNIQRLTLNSVKKIDVAKELFIEIFSEGDEEFNRYCRCGKFERVMKYRDIVYVDIKYDDGSVQTIYVEYDGNAQNQCQTNWMSKLGNLYIAISRKKIVEDFILEHEANDKAMVNLRKPLELIARPSEDELESA